LHDGEESVHCCLSPFLLLTSVFSEAQVIFKAGKNRDVYFGAQELLAQVDHAINIFEGLSNGNFKAIFLFDNASSH
jgi:DNA polymerase III sliding clamp (beta) subunit (PCNA family)